MRNFLLSCLCFLCTNSYLLGQTTLATQDFETSPSTPTLAFTNTGGATQTGNSPSVGRPASSPLYNAGSQGFGLNNGTSTITFASQNVSGYTSLSFEARVGSFSKTSSNGADVGDYIQIFVSTNGGTTFSNELQLTGFSNACWAFAGATGVATTAYDGNNSATVVGPTAGGLLTGTNAYGTIKVTGIPTTSQLVIKIVMLNNDANEIWVIDDAKLSGTAIPPTITIPSPNLSPFLTGVGTPSSAQTYTVSGNSLTDDITITAPSGFEIRTGVNSYGSSIILTQSSGTVASTSIDVRLTGASVGTFSDNIMHVSSGATTQNVAVSGTVSSDPVPTITTTGTLTAFSTTAGRPSPAQSYSVAGQDLTANLIITAPTGFEIKTGGDSYASSITLIPASGSVPTTQIDVRLTGVTSGTFSGNITNASSGGTTQNVAGSGTVDELIRAVRATIPSTASFTGATYAIRGQVTALFGGNKFYVSDSTGGIAVFTNGIVGALIVGDSVEVKGTAARFNGEAELSTVTSLIKLTQGTAPTPKVFDSNAPPTGVALNDFLTANEGNYVKVISSNIESSGTFTTGVNYTFVSCNNQGGSEIRIDATASSFSNVAIPSVTQDITGVVGHYITANGGTDKLQVYPRTTADLSNSTTTCPSTGGGAGCGVASVLGNAQTLDLMIWNVEWLGSPTNGPTQSGSNDATQIANVQTVLNSVGADVYILEEVCAYNRANPTDVTKPFGKLIQSLNTTFGANTYTGECSPDTSKSQPDNFAQHVCIIYKNSVITKISSRPMFHNFSVPTYPPTGDTSQFWSSGRKPFVFKAQVNLNGKVDTLVFVGLHSKAGSDSVSYKRRKYDVKVMYDTLQAQYPHDKIIMAGDYNDDVDVSIYPNHISSYSPFLYTNPNETNINGVRPNADFVAVTKVLSDEHCASTASYPDDIDHVTISNELTSAVSSTFSYIDGSATNFKPFSIISNYSATTSDHFPILVRFRSQPCPDNLNLTSTATGTSNYVAGTSITATNTVQTGANVTYDAGKNIVLQPGFNTETSAVFKTQLVGCF